MYDSITRFPVYALNKTWFLRYIRSSFLRSITVSYIYNSKKRSAKGKQNLRLVWPASYCLYKYSSWISLLSTSKMLYSEYKFPIARMWIICSTCKRHVEFETMQAMQGFFNFQQKTYRSCQIMWRLNTRTCFRSNYVI